LAFFVLLALSSHDSVSAAQNTELINKRLANSSDRRRNILNRAGGGKWWEEEGFMVNGQPTATRGLQTKKNHGLGNGISEAAAAAAAATTTEDMAMRRLRAARRSLL
jgi:hypothetical protein